MLHLKPQPCLRLLPAWRVAAALLASCAALPVHQLSLHQMRAGVGAPPHDAPRNHSSEGVVGSRGVCSALEHTGLYRQAEADFARYSHGLSPAQRANYSEYCARKDPSRNCFSVLVVGGRLFVRHLAPGWQSRVQTTLHAIWRVAQRFGPLPDVELVVDTSDGGRRADLPLFVMSRKRTTRRRVLYPDFTFFSFPESVCPPDVSHAYGYLLAQYAEQARRDEADAEASWAAKRDVVFWRGSDNEGGNRTEVADILAEVPGTDVKLTVWDANFSVSTGGMNVGCLGLLDTCRYRYLAYLEGNSYSSSLKYKLLCGSCVIGPLQYVEWWSGSLRPWEDFVQVRSDWKDAAEKVAAVRALPDGGRAIAERGRRKVMSMLTEDAVDCYWLRLIELASPLLPPPSLASLGTGVRPIEDVLLYPRNVLMDGKEVKEVKEEV